jgi:hypothetical protein
VTQYDKIVAGFMTQDRATSVPVVGFTADKVTLLIEMIVDLGVNWDESGVCIASVSGAPLPDTFSLQVGQKKEIAEATVMWRVENTVGEKFVKPNARQH